MDDERLEIGHSGEVSSNPPSLVVPMETRDIEDKSANVRQADMVGDNWRNKKRRVGGTNNGEMDVLINLGREQGQSVLEKEAVAMLLEDVLSSVDATIDESVVRLNIPIRCPLATATLDDSGVDNLISDERKVEDLVADLNRKEREQHHGLCGDLGLKNGTVDPDSLAGRDDAEGIVEVRDDNGKIQASETSPFMVTRR